MLQSNGTENTNEQLKAVPLASGWLIPVTLFAGLIIGGPLAGMMLHQSGERRKGIITGAGALILGIGILTVCFFWKIEWYWIALVLSTFHIIAGIFLHLFINKPVSKTRERIEKKERGNYRNKISGIFGGLAAALIIGPIPILSYILITDWLFSSYMPIAFSDLHSLNWFYFYLFITILAGMTAGGLIGRFKPKISVPQVFFYGIVFYWAFLILAFWLQLIIAIPSFQASSTTGKSLSDITGPLSAYLSVFGAGWAICLMFYTVSGKGTRERLFRLIHIVVVNLAVTVVFSITFGYPSEFFLFLGQHYERHARGDKALIFYERSLNKSPQKKVASYLQYRIALLNYKAGEMEKAGNCFSRVIAKYNYNERLVKKANYFRRRLKKSTTKKRVVLPGVETQTEYKGTYCVPNSLALTMRFWGKNVSPRKIGSAITSLNKGTHIVDQTWFAQKEGFRHEFLPLAEPEDIKKLIDAGFPVLVYVPAHIFVIFGYDETLSTFVTYDVATHDVWVEYIQKDFIKAWKRQAATLAVAYPPDQEKNIPKSLSDRLFALSNQYFHYQLHFFDTLSSGFSMAHLKRAAGEKGDFFFPVVTMYMDYSGLRDEITKQYPPQKIADDIYAFFARNFDEGAHLWGQYHNESWALTDWALRYGIAYLVAHQQYELVEKLITGIDEKGIVTDDMLEILGMIDLAHGRFKKGLDRLQRADVYSGFYMGLLHLQQDNIHEGVRQLDNVLSAELSDFYYGYGSLELDLDQYGYPVLPITNNLLTQIDSLGESKENIQKRWEQWLDKSPYDIATAKALCRIYEQTLASLKQKDETELYENLNVKYQLIKERAERYSIEKFQ